MTLDGFEEGLEAAADKAAQDSLVDPHPADSRSPFDLADWRVANEADLNSPDRLLLGHALRLGATWARDIRGITESRGPKHKHRT